MSDHVENLIKEFETHFKEAFRLYVIQSLRSKGWTQQELTTRANITTRTLRRTLNEDQKPSSRTVSEVLEAIDGWNDALGEPNTEKFEDFLHNYIEKQKRKTVDAPINNDTTTKFTEPEKRIDASSQAHTILYSKINEWYKLLAENQQLKYRVILGSIVSVVALFVIWPWLFSSEPKNSQVRAPQKRYDVSTKSRYENNLSTSDMKAEISLRYHDKNFYLSNILVSGTPSYYTRAFYKNGSSEYKEFKQGSQDKLDISKQAKLHVLIKHRDSGKILYEADKSDSFHKQVHEFYATRIKSINMNDIINDELRCDISGCSKRVNNTNLCSPMVEKAYLRSKNQVHEVSREFCKNWNEENTCVSPSRLSVPLNVQEHLTLDIRYVNKTSAQTKLPVSVMDTLLGEFRSSGTFRGKHYFNLKTQPAIQPNGKKGKPFYIVASFWHRASFNYVFYLAIGLDRCEFPKKTLPLTVYFDIDGSGFTSAGQASNRVYELIFYHFKGKLDAHLSNFSLPVNRPSKITVAIGNAAQPTETLGSFIFDPAKIMSHVQEKRSDPPEIVCSGGNRSPSWIQNKGNKFCVPHSPAAMVGVSQVRFGKSKDDLNVAFDINFSYFDYLTSKGLFVFSIPDDWKNVHSQIIMKDGSKTRPVRHIVR